jgi:hypothetical protein
MGITASTPTNLVVGAGNVLREDTDLGASQDANVFKIDRKYFTPELNGVPGGLIATDYVQSEEGSLTTALVEVSPEILASLWPGSAIGTGAGDTSWADDEIRFGGDRRLAEADYVDWELVVPGLTNEFGFFVEGAINLGSISASADDKANMKTQLELHSRWDPADLSVSPHGFRIAAI